MSFWTSFTLLDSYMICNFELLLNCRGFSRYHYPSRRNGKILSVCFVYFHETIMYLKFWVMTFGICTTLLSLLRIPIFCHFGSTSFVMPIRPKYGILNRDRRVKWSLHQACITVQLALKIIVLWPSKCLQEWWKVVTSRYLALK